MLYNRLMNTHWIILDRAGKPVDTATFSDRPADSNELEDGNEYTPWHRLEEHIHIEHGKIDGIHARGDAEEVKKVLDYCLDHETEIIEHFGVKEDNIVLVDVLKYLVTL